MKNAIHAQEASISIQRFAKSSWKFVLVEEEAKSLAREKISENHSNNLNMDFPYYKN